jgi:hypothetical protein
MAKKKKYMLDMARNGWNSWIKLEMAGNISYECNGLKWLEMD